MRQILQLVLCDCAHLVSLCSLCRFKGSHLVLALLISLIFSPLHIFLNPPSTPNIVATRLSQRLIVTKWDVLTL